MSGEEMKFDLKKTTLHILLPLAMLVVGLYFVPVKIFQSDFSKLPGDMGDTRFNNYILEHDYQFLTGKVHNYWDAPFMYPIQNVIAFSDNLLGTAPVYSLFRLIGVDRETSFQCWFLSLFILNFICCWWVLKKWSGNPVLAAVGAYIFTFSIFIIGNINHVQNFPRFIIPFVFYWTWKYLTERKLKYFLLFLLGLVFQFYCGIYLGFFLIYCLLFFVLAYLLIYRDKQLFVQFKSIKKIGLHLSMLILASLLLAPLMLPYLKISHQFGMRKFEEVLPTIPTIRSYFFTTKAPLCWQSLSNHGVTVFGNFWDHFLFMGIMPWLGIIAIPAVLFFRRSDGANKKMIVFVFVGLALSFIFCLNINGFTLYKYVFELPGFSSMRSINRVLNTEVMFFVLIFVFVFDFISRKSRVAKWIVLSFPVLVVCDNLINPNEVLRFDKVESQQQIALVKKSIIEQYDHKHEAIAYLTSSPFDSTNIELGIAKIQLNVMLATQELHIPCVNAYTGSYPYEYLEFLAKGNDWSISKWLNYMHFDKDRIQNIYDFATTAKKTESIQLIASNNKFVAVNEAMSNELVANSDLGNYWETFTLFSFEKTRCSLYSSRKCFVSNEVSNGNIITAMRNNIGEWESFNIKYLDKDSVALRACNGKYLSINRTSNVLFASADSIGTAEKFKLIKLK